jgi:hypothetical protein
MKFTENIIQREPKPNNVMKNIKTTVIALLLLSGAAFALSSCEEEQVLPSTVIEITGSADGGGMEDDGQFD